MVQSNSFSVCLWQKAGNRKIILLEQAGFGVLHGWQCLHSKYRTNFWKSGHLHCSHNWLGSDRLLFEPVQTGWIHTQWIHIQLAASCTWQLSLCMPVENSHFPPAAGVTWGSCCCSQEREGVQQQGTEIKGCCLWGGGWIRYQDVQCTFTLFSLPAWRHTKTLHIQKMWSSYKHRLNK